MVQADAKKEPLRRWYRRETRGRKSNRPRLIAGSRKRERPPADAAEVKTPPQAPKPVAPSAATPKPQTVGALPTRNSLRAVTQVASKAAPLLEKPKKKAAPEPEVAVPVPGGEEEDTRVWWEASMGPIGIFATALLACAIGYLAFRLFN